MVEFKNLSDFKEAAPHLFGKPGHNVNIQVKQVSNNLSDTAVSPQKNIDVEKVIKEALAEKDLTPEKAAQIKKEFAHNPQALQTEVNKYKGSRLKMLDAMDYKELDRQGLLQELHDKDYATFRKKYMLQFGKEPSTFDAKKLASNASDTETSRLEQILINDKKYTKQQLQQWKDGHKGDNNKYNAWLHTQIKMDGESLKNKSWDELDKSGGLPVLKQMHFDVFKEKYKQKFGTDYPGKQ